uniref:Uncharacterized protein n=1 Tax=viral metagenome TaxID=1070528 RepID=A0A6C0KS53_9ZZZZ
MSGSFAYQNMVQALLTQAVSGFKNLKSQYASQNEIYLLEVNADQLFHNPSDPFINANAITNDIDDNLKLKLHSPQNSDLRVLLILNETNSAKKLDLTINANIGSSKAFGLFQLNYSNISIQNFKQVLFNTNQNIKINEHVELILNPEDLICVLVGTVNDEDDEEETMISLCFNKDTEYCSMGPIIFGAIVIILIIVLLYFLLQGDKEPEEEETHFYF